MLWFTAVNEVVARRACTNLFNTYRKEAVDILLQVVYTRVPRKSFWLCNMVMLMVMVPTAPMVIVTWPTMS